MAATGLTCILSMKIYFLVFTLFQLTKTNSDVNVQVHRRFEYKFSFKPPYLAQKDGTVPFWEYGGSKYLQQKKVKVVINKNFRNPNQTRQLMDFVVIKDIRSCCSLSLIRIKNKLVSLSKFPNCCL